MKIDLKRVRALADTARAAMQQQQQRSARSGFAQSWYRITNAGPGKTEIYLYDMIGMWGVTAQDFVDELRQVKAGTIDLHINSEGGEVFDGLAIFEAIASHKASVTAYVDGFAASAASFIAMAADRVVIAKHAKMMIHDASGLTFGNAAEMRAMADLLDTLSDTIADIYADKAGGTRTQWRDAMRETVGGPDGHWYNADDAVTAGLADEIARSNAGEGGDGGPTDRTSAGTSTGHRRTSHSESGDLGPDAAEELDWSPNAFLGLVHDIEAGPVRPLDEQSMRDLIDIP